MRNTLQVAARRLTVHTAKMIHELGEFVILKRRTEIENPNRPPHGFSNHPDFVYESFPVRAMVQNDNKGQLFVYGQFVAQPGDIIIRLRGEPQTPESAVKTAPSGFLKVIGEGDIRREQNGSIIYGKYPCIYDKTNKWEV